MRPKFVFALFIFAFLVLGAALFLKQHIGPKRTSPHGGAEIVGTLPVASNTVRNAHSSSAPVSRPLPAASASSPPLAPLPAILTPEERQAAADAEVDRLQKWAMNNDPASLSNILNDLTYPDKEVREAAIDATEQFGSSDAIPALKAAAEMTDDPQEKIDYLQAADFLSLPPIQFSGPVVQPTPEQMQFEEKMRAARAKREAQLEQRSQQDHNHGPQIPSGQNPPAAPNNQ